MAKICIVTTLHLCRNPRVVKEAETLGRVGHDVTVVTTANHPPSEEQDRAMLDDAPYKRLLALNRFSGDLRARLRSLQSRGVVKLARECVRRFGWQCAHAMGPVGALLKTARTLPADLTIAHTEAAFWVALRLAAEGCPIAADFEDWHSEDLQPVARRSLPLKLLRAVELEILNCSTYTTATSDAMADALHARYGGERPHVITNSFPLQPDPLAGRVANEGRDPSLFWFSQTLGPGRGLGLFLAAWRQTTQPSRLVLLGEPQVGYREKIMSRLPEAFRSRVEFLPLVSPEELPSVIARHDIGLALEERSILNRNLTITNKILQYLNAGLAIVASDTAGQREVLAKAPEAGIIIELHETAAVARSLDQLLGNRTELRRRQVAARAAAEKQYCWEREAPRLLSAVETALSRAHIASA